MSRRVDGAPRGLTTRLPMATDQEVQAQREACGEMRSYNGGRTRQQSVGPSGKAKPVRCDQQIRKISDYVSCVRIW